MRCDVSFAVIDDGIRCTKLMSRVKRGWGHRYQVRSTARTLPSLPSNNLTGQSLTEVTKQNAGGLCRDAPGYHVKSTIGAGCGNVPACARDGDVDVDVDEAAMEREFHETEDG